MVVAFVVPAIAVFFDGANFGALPVLVGRGRIAEANAAVWGAQTVVEIVIPSLVGGRPRGHLAGHHAGASMRSAIVVSACFVVRIGRTLHDPTARAIAADRARGLSARSARGCASSSATPASGR